jgi:hypothetical protein
MYVWYHGSTYILHVHVMYVCSSCEASCILKLVHAIIHMYIHVFVKNVYIIIIFLFFFLKKKDGSYNIYLFCSIPGILSCVHMYTFILVYTWY